MSNHDTRVPEMVKKMHATLPPAQLKERLAALGPWFYRFEFDNQIATESFADENALRIHESRVQTIIPFLDKTFEGRWSEISCFDVACHEGWFALQIAQRGARAVKGIDIRPDRIGRANFIRAAAGIGNAQFEVRDLFTLSPQHDGVHDLTLFLGIFYHLEDPVRAFRIARAITRKVCIIEGQVARFHENLTTAWGSSQETRSGPACVVIDADPHHSASSSGVSLVPSLEALQKIIRAAGFHSVELVNPSPSLHEQYVHFDRVILFAFA